jgi:protein ImuA
MTPYLPLFDLPLLEPGIAETGLSFPQSTTSQPTCEQEVREQETPEPVELSAFQKMERLTRQIRDMETAGRPDQARISSGCRAMDRHLPQGGYARGSMLELLRSGSGSGVTSLALLIARQAIVDGKYLVVVDPQRQFYPPAMKSLGIPLERVIALQPANHADAIWGLAQVLRCSAVGAVIAEVGTLEDRIARKLQLATEQGGGLGVFIRDALSARSQPSWADVQWLVRAATPAPHLRSLEMQQQDTRWFHLELTRCSGGRTGARISLGVNGHGQWIDAPQNQGARHEHASAMHLAAQLAQPTRRSREIAG